MHGIKKLKDMNDHTCPISSVTSFFARQKRCCERWHYFAQKGRLTSLYNKNHQNNMVTSIHPTNPNTLLMKKLHFQIRKKSRHKLAAENDLSTLQCAI